MFKWFKNLFGSTPTSVVEIPKAETKVEKPKPVAKTKAEKSAPKTKKKAQKSADIDAMSKKDLLAHAKAKGIKANASMNKAALVDAIKNAK